MTSNTDQAWNTQDKIGQKLRFLGQSAGKWDLADILEEAHRRTIQAVGRKIEEELVPTRAGIMDDNSSDVQTDFELAFSQVENFKRVERLDEEVQSSNYTVTEIPAKIVFDQGWAEDELENLRYRLTAVYVPKVFRDLELAYAITEVLNLVTVQTQDEEARAKFTAYKERTEELKDQINKKAAQLADPERGSRVAANRRHSDRYP